MKRKQALLCVEYAGCHNDTKAGTRLLIEQRISREAYNEAFIRGRTKRTNGMKCTCKDCNPKDPD